MCARREGDLGDRRQVGVQSCWDRGAPCNGVRPHPSGVRCVNPNQTQSLGGVPPMFVVPCYQRRLLYGARRCLDGAALFGALFCARWFCVSNGSLCCWCFVVFPSDRICASGSQKAESQACSRSFWCFLGGPKAPPHRSTPHGKSLGRLETRFTRTKATAAIRTVQHFSSHTP